MEGTDPKEKLRGTYWEALKKNWMVWPLVQAVNFRFVPLVHRVLVVNVVSLGEFVPGGRWKGSLWGSGDVGREGALVEREGTLLTCLRVYRMELLPQLREQPGREGEAGGCAREGGTMSERRRGCCGAV